jgi:tetratricopeptide (TPR) repeat protein
MRWQVGTTFSNRGPLRGANIRRVMKTALRLALILAALVLVAPLAAHAHAEAGTVIENVELATIAGGKERLLSAKAKANILVFFRTGQERSFDALKMLAICEKEMAGKPVHWVGLVSSSEVTAEVQDLVARAGISMPVLIDQDDRVYGALAIRLHPMVGIADGKFRLSTVEMYRQIDYCEIVKARIKVMLGELDAAGMELVLNPPKGTMPGDDVRDVARRDVNLGRRQLKIMQYDKALVSANKALEKAPLASAFALIGDVQAAKGNCAAALKQYDQALKLDPAEKYALEGKKACAGK